MGCCCASDKQKRNTNRASPFGAPLAPKLLKNRQSTLGGSLYRFRAGKRICGSCPGKADSRLASVAWCSPWEPAPASTNAQRAQGRPGRDELQLIRRDRRQGPDKSSVE